MTTKEKIEVMQAYEDGKAIEESLIDSTHWKSVTISKPVWDWRNRSYRIKPEPAPTSLLSRIEKVYGLNHDVVELKWDLITWNDREKRENTAEFLCIYGRSHMEAQSMKGFYRYVYEGKAGIYLSANPTDVPTNLIGDPIEHPVAVLFTK